MTEPIEWLPDGTPYSPRFGDRYHSENGGLTQARRVFLHGCGLPEAWAGQPQWRILETGFGFGLNFLVTWAAWRADLQRPTLLHFVSTEAGAVSAAALLRAASAHPERARREEALRRQWWGLLPGVHRLRFDEGRVLLTLYVGDTQAMLRQQNLTVDSIYLDGFSPQRNPESWDLHTLKAVARSCRRGTQLATWTIARAVRDGLAQCGFEVNRVPGVPPKRDNLHATYNPRWEPRTTRQPVAAPDPALPGPCIGIGGGIAGAAAAASLARRGWHVTVLDQASEPAAGASALPAGVFAPHVSPDDSVLSRLSRSGIRTTLEQACWLLSEGVDWDPCGVLEHRTDGTPGLSPGWLDGPGAAWSEPAPPATPAAAQPPRCWRGRASAGRAAARWRNCDTPSPPPPMTTRPPRSGRRWMPRARCWPRHPRWSLRRALAVWSCSTTAGLCSRFGGRCRGGTMQTLRRRCCRFRPTATATWCPAFRSAAMRVAARAGVG